MKNKILLGRTGIEISPLGLGLMQWGDINPDQFPSAGTSLVTAMFNAALDSGVNFFDTAEMYGRGKSELHLRRCLGERSNNSVIATKFMPFPWRLSKRQFKSALAGSLKRIGISHIDLYQIHWPFPPVPIHTWMDAMAEAVDDGLIKAVGVSNYSPKQMKIAFDTLAKYKIPLASNQVKYNLLDQRPEQSGLVELCNQLGITIIAYSPLERGILTGRYNSKNLPRGLLAWRYNKTVLAKINPLFNTMREIGKNHGGKTLAMIALNWLMSKGVVPIPGASSLNQALENFGALGWQLDSDDIDRIDRLSMQLI